MARAVFCTVKSTTQAAAIVDRLKAAGFLAKDISVLAPDKNDTKEFAIDNETKAPEGAATGAGTGALVGGGPQDCRHRAVRPRGQRRTL